MALGSLGTGRALQTLQPFQALEVLGEVVTRSADASGAASASSASVTFAPLGGVKSKVEAAGLAKLTWVKPASTTAAPPLAGVSVNFSGRPVPASTATLIAPTVEPDCFGLITRR